MPKITTGLYGELALIPHPAQVPVGETLEYLTDVQESKSGLEEYYQLRTKARQTYAYSIPTQAWNVAKVFNTSYGGLRRRWAVPVWTEAQYVGTVAGGATSIVCDVTLYDLRASSLAMLWREGWDTYQIVEIGSLGASQINLTSPATAMTGAWLIPVRIGYVANTIAHKTNGHNGVTSVTFEIDDALNLTPSAPTQYLSHDVYYTPGLLEGATLDKALEQRNNVFDTELGVVTRRTPWVNARYGSNYRTLTTDAAEMRAHKEFLARRAGKYRDFWMPTFEQHLRPVNVGNIASTLTIEADSFNDYTFRPNIAFLDSSGNWHPRVVSNPTPVIGNRLNLTLSSPLNIDASLIVNVCYLGLHRLDSDRIEISWIGNGVAESNVRILELTP